MEKESFPLYCTKPPHLAIFVVLLYQNRRTIMETMNSFPKHGLQLMSDEYILENLIEELRETQQHQKWVVYVKSYEDYLCSP